MNENELEELIENRPRLYHMAEEGSWPTIRDHGLMSTIAILDFLGVEGERRQEIESERRATSITVGNHNDLSITIRDQKPMNDAALVRCLRDDLSPEDWYRILNRRTFFWLTIERLEKLLCAGSYADSPHDVLVVDIRSLVGRHRGAITLSPMNSGNTRPYPHPRGLDTFLSIEEYPYADRKARRLETVVELAVDYSVPDIADHVVQVFATSCGGDRSLIWER